MTDSRAALPSIRFEFERYRGLAEGAMAQLDAAALCAPPQSGLAISSIVWHIAGNLESRFTDFLTTDGEKPWRDREGEFGPRVVSREELEQRWEDGWSVLFAALDELAEEDLGRQVTIRRQPFSIIAALHRSLAHTAYHVGQIIYVAKNARGEAWEWLTVPPSGTEENGDRYLNVP